MRIVIDRPTPKYMFFRYTSVTGEEFLSLAFGIYDPARHSFTGMYCKNARRAGEKWVMVGGGPRTRRSLKVVQQHMMQTAAHTAGRWVAGQSRLSRTVVEQELMLGVVVEIVEGSHAN